MDGGARRRHRAVASGSGWPSRGQHRVRSDPGLLTAVRGHWAVVTAARIRACAPAGPGHGDRPGLDPPAQRCTNWASSRVHCRYRPGLLCRRSTHQGPVWTAARACLAMPPRCLASRCPRSLLLEAGGPGGAVEDLARGGSVIARWRGGAPRTAGPGQACGPAGSAISEAAPGVPGRAAESLRVGTGRAVGPAGQRGARSGWPGVAGS